MSVEARRCAKGGATLALGPRIEAGIYERFVFEEERKEIVALLTRLTASLAVGGMDSRLPIPIFAELAKNHVVDDDDGINGVSIDQFSIELVEKGGD